MNPVASFIDKFQTGPIKQRRRHRTLTATALAIAANAGIGIVATDPNSAWYRSLKKPAIQPPNWVFPLVWNPIFLATGHVVGHSLADLEEREGKAQHFTELKESFAANIALNAGWSLLFFRGHAPFLSTIESALLFGSTVDEALSEMELVGHDFYLFVDEETQRPSVVYRRHAFDYGIISLSEEAEA